MPDIAVADFGAQRSLERAGTPLAYWVRGATTVPLLLFTHGAGCDHRMFAPQMDVFAAGHRVLTHDVRGHGSSRPLARPFRIQDAVDDIVALLDDVGAQRAVLVGQSMGGNISQEVLFRYPERVEAIVNLGCTCNTFPLTRMERWSAGPLGMAMLRAYPAKSLLRTIAKRSSIMREVQEYILDAEAVLTKTEFCDVFASLLGILHEETGYRIAIPELIMRGDSDRLGNFQRVMPLWHRRDPCSELMVIPEAGHVANMDNADVFNRTLLDWLRRAVPATPAAATPGETAAVQASA
jgi:pimeloyl-ACP methyl ester carboxylesterase